jgi:Domain of unknown function (DUF4783)
MHIRIMKDLIGMIFLVFLSAFTLKSSEPKKLNLNEISRVISQSFKVGNSDLLSSCLDKEIELIIDGDRIEYQNLPASQAKPILNLFFKKNPPLSFSYVYQGANNSALKYCIGNYRSKNNDYLVYMLIKKDKNDRFLVNTLQLKKD